MKTIPAAVAIFALTATTALDAAAPVLQPVPYGNETLRHAQGQPTIEVRGRNGTIQITPLPMDHGCVNFGLIAFNHSNRPANIDLANVTIFVGDAPATVLTVHDLQKRADKRAFWTSVAIAAVGGVAAGVAAASSSHATVRTHTPRGSYVSRVSYRDGSSSLNGAIIAGGTAAAVGSVQEKADRIRAAIGDEILQLTTIDPGDAYGGRVVIDKIKAPPPQTIMMSVEWNGEVYTTKWQLVPEGTPAPAFTTLVAASAIPAPIASTQPVGRVEPAVLRVETQTQGPLKPLQAATPPQLYPHDDTVQIPM